MNTNYVYGIGSQAEELIYMIEKKSFKKVRGLTKKTIRSELATEDCEPTENLKNKNPKIFLAIGSPYYKREEVKMNTSVSFSGLIPSDFTNTDFKRIGQGCIIMPGSIITNNVSLGDYCTINIGCTISHDVKIGDFTTISPGVNVAGKVQIGKGVFIGIGATISNESKIADGVTIGAGAVVIGDLDVENGIYIGCPAKLSSRGKDWIKKI